MEAGYLGVGSFAKVLDRAELDFDLPGLRHGCVGAIEGAISPCGAAAPAGKGSHCSQRGGYSKAPHGIGRNTQIAAGSLDPARTATNNRSSSGTNKDVRAPDTVGTRASRR